VDATTSGWNSLKSSSSDKTIRVGFLSRLASTYSTISHSGDDDRWSDSIVVGDDADDEEEEDGISL